MRILSFHIDGFGIFHNAGGEDLSPNLNIFYGRNEAGKSTCLEFFRAMLAGYPDKTAKNRRIHEPLNGGHPGGSLVLATRDGQLYLHRSPPAAGGLSLRTHEGNILHAEDLAKLLGGISREVYCRIFGFSLAELESWTQKNDDSFRNVLYGASFGPGLLSPGEVLAKLDRDMGKIFKPRGLNQPLVAELNRLGSLRQDIRHWEREYAQYDTLAAESSKTAEHLRKLKDTEEELQLERASLERRLNVARQWTQWRILSDKLASFPPIPDTLPENIPMRLSALENEQNTCVRNAAAAAEKLRQLESAALAQELNAPLLALLPTLRSLAERKSGYRHAVSAIPNLTAEKDRLANDLQKNLSMLGQNWTCERIAQTDRSLFAREGMEKQAAEMNVAKMSHQAALDALQRANADSVAAKKEMEDAEEMLRSLPEPPAILDGDERDLLRSLMSRLDETRRSAPGRQRALDAATHTFHRALGQAGIPENREDCGAILEKLLQNQDRARELAANIGQNLATARAGTEKLARAEADVENLKARLASMLEAQGPASGSNRENLATRMAALRSLRNLAPQIAAEEERKRELENRISQEKKSPHSPGRLLPTFAILFLVAAAAIFCAHQFWHIDSLELGNGLHIPLNLWAAYAALVCGVVLFGGSYSTNSPERKRRQQELANLEARIEACSNKLGELKNQSAQLCATIGIDSLDPIALDAMELLFEREKEQLINDERSTREIDEFRQTLEGASEQARIFGAEARAAEVSVQQARKAWHEFMLRLGLVNVPSAESADTLFAKLEAATLAKENMEHANTELEALWDDLHQIEKAITDMPPIKKCLDSAPAPLNLEEAVSITLEQCREADSIRDRRKEYAHALANASAEHERATTRQAEAYTLLEEAAARLGAAGREWAKHMADLGLPDDLNPETVREAFKYMDLCLATEEKLLGLNARLQEARSELANMEQPLAKCLNDLHMEARLGEDNTPDWLGTLDFLLSQAEAAQRINEKQQMLHTSIAEQKANLAVLEASAASARGALQEFLQLGNVDTVDQFLKLASLREEQRSLSLRKNDLEALLTQNADAESPEAFLKSFENQKPEELEKRLAEVGRKLQEIGAEAQQVATNQGTLQARADGLANADTLATLQQEAANSEQLCEELANRWRVLALAKELVIGAREIFERERQPVLIQRASRLFASITDGKWAGLALNLEDASVVALAPDGVAVEPVNLSRGTQEQAYLALRLAYIQEHSASHEPLPVIMDEIMVNFDPVRAERTARTLAEFSAADNQQILYFTCQPHMVGLLKEAFVAPAVYEVENGTIRAA